LKDQIKLQGLDLLVNISHFVEKSDSGKMCLMIEILVVSADVLLGVNEAILTSNNDYCFRLNFGHNLFPFPFKDLHSQ